MLDFSKSVVYTLDANLKVLKTSYLSKNPNDILHITPTKYGIFYYNLQDKTVYVYTGYPKAFIKLSSPIITLQYDNQNRLLVQSKTDLRIFDITTGNVLFYYSINDFNSMPKSYGNVRSFITSYLTNNYLYIISDTYTAFAIDLNNSNVINEISNIGEATGKFLNMEKYNLLVGRKVITAYNALNRLPWFYKTSFETMDSFEYNNSLYLISKDTNGITLRKLLPNWR